MGKSITDHLGNEYKSITKMCDCYNIPRTTYIRRLERGWTQEAALTTPSGNTIPTSYVRVSTEDCDTHKEEKAAYMKEYYQTHKEERAARNAS